MPRARQCSINLFIPILVLLSLSSCSDYQHEDIKLRITTTSWTGYEFLYLAEQKGFFKTVGLDVELIEVGSVRDILRVFSRGQSDGFASSITQAVRVSSLAKKDVDIALVVDYSSGSDVIIAKYDINSVADLVGKRVGVQTSSLGSFVLYQALKHHGLAFSDVEMVHIEQIDIKDHLMKHHVDAVVTYTPYSVGLENIPGFHKIFSTKDIPGDVIDTLNIKADIIEKYPDLVKRLHMAWGMALNYAVNYQEDAYRLMASHEQMSLKNFVDAVSGLTLIWTADQRAVLGSKQLQNNVLSACHVLALHNPHLYDCKNIIQNVRPVNLQ